MNPQATNRHPIPRTLLLSLTAALITACASNPAQLSDPEADPWEMRNRQVLKFNLALDRAVLKPVARAYDKITPDPLQKGIHNALENLAYPRVILNLALQGKFKESVIGTGRFLFNSTIGLLGLFDVASRAGMPEYEEDFGQTLAVWGIKQSPYLMLPIFGPTTLRDGIGRIPDSFASGEGWFIREHHQPLPAVFGVIDTRVGLLPQDQTLSEAPDQYLLIRDAYLQQREFKIYDGDPPLPDYEDYYLDE